MTPHEFEIWEKAFFTLLANAEFRASMVHEAAFGADNAVDEWKQRRREIQSFAPYRKEPSQ